MKAPPSKLPNGKPIFDGYLIGVSSSLNDPGYLPLYNDEPFVPIESSRRKLKKTDARVIEFLTESDVELAKGRAEVPDSDERMGGHRVYELAAVIHTDNLVDPTLSRKDMPHTVQLRNNGYKFASVSTVSSAKCDLPPSDIPQAAFVRAAVDNLRQWGLTEALPPRGVPLDELPKGELEERYGSSERYLALYDSAVDQLVSERWLLPEDGLKLRAKPASVWQTAFRAFAS